MTKFLYSPSDIIPAMNNFMAMQGFQLVGIQEVRFLVKKSNPVEMPGLLYHDKTNNRFVVVCTSGSAGSMDYEYTTSFKMCPVKSTGQLPRPEPFELDYSKYPLCALFWKLSMSGRDWDCEAPFLESYIASQSLKWKLGIHEQYSFML